jgi:hypothetical protein
VQRENGLDCCDQHQFNMAMTSRVWERMDGVLDKERVLDGRRRSEISPEQIEHARLVLPYSVDPTGATICWPGSDSTATAAWSE